MEKKWKVILIILFMLPMALFFPACSCGGGGEVDESKLNSYSVMFYTDSGESGSYNYETVIVKHGHLCPRPDDPRRTGYAFVGWYKEKECVNIWVFDYDKIYDTTTLYAKWIEQDFS